VLTREVNQATTERGRHETRAANARAFRFAPGDRYAVISNMPPNDRQCQAKKFKDSYQE
jgi:hypothetical protein